MGSVWSWSLQELCDPEAWKCSYFLVVSLQLGGGRVKEWLFWCEEGVKQHWESMSRCLRSQSLLEWSPSSLDEGVHNLPHDLLLLLVGAEPQNHSLLFDL